MKKIFKLFKFYDYGILFGIIGMTILQTFFEIKFISITEKLLDLVENRVSIKSEYYSIGGQMLLVATIVVVGIIIKNILLGGKYEQF